MPSHGLLMVERSSSDDSNEQITTCDLLKKRTAAATTRRPFTILSAESLGGGQLRSRRVSRGTRKSGKENEEPRQASRAQPTPITKGSHSPKVDEFKGGVPLLDGEFEGTSEILRWGVLGEDIVSPTTPTAVTVLDDLYFRHVAKVQ
ncbi:hypothetical protein FOZ63_020953 [Perkinsus olseni]|uniref:Uncharacterized protein n=1 Tax=Perkinsus olseni TaxID=32597 RepID=A0A7J6TKE0_PEROL|nr:hypothetical protein FOZ63_020953 [Perkinsus olseni]KAF4745277.1 hypothetical protein FOZ62_001393 [Perkinsus olseni]